MDFRRPFTVVTPTLDGDVLSALAAADVEFSGRELARRAGHGSAEGIRRAADRLALEGVVLRRVAGGAHLYRLNRDHIAARWIEGLATLPEQLIDRLRTVIAGWAEAASLAFMFGSVARRQAASGSDLDILIVRRRGCDPDSDTWRSQLVHLQEAATALTGNDTRVLEIGEEELGGGRIEPVLEDVLREGVELLGSRRKLQRLVDSKRGRR
jgi:predicted nucleotidyltransferase